MTSSSIFPFPDEVARVELRPALHDGVEDHDVGNPRQLRELQEALFLRLDAPGRDADQDRPLAPIGPIELPALFREVVLEIGDEIDEVEIDLARRRRLHQIPGVGPGVPVRRGRKIRGAHEPRKPVRSRLDGGHRVEAQQHEVGQIVPGQRFLAEMGVEAPQSAETPFGYALPLQVRQDDLPRVAHTDPLHFAFAVDEHSNLAPDLPRDLGELAGELLGYERAWRKPPLVELLEPVPFAGLEAVYVAFETVNTG